MNEVQFSAGQDNIASGEKGLECAAPLYFRRLFFVASSFLIQPGTATAAAFIAFVCV